MKKTFIKGMDRNKVVRFEIESGQKLPPGIIAGKEWTLTAESKEEAQQQQK